MRALNMALKRMDLRMRRKSVQGVSVLALLFLMAGLSACGRFQSRGAGDPLPPTSANPLEAEREASGRNTLLPGPVAPPPAGPQATPSATPSGVRPEGPVAATSPTPATPAPAPPSLTEEERRALFSDIFEEVPRTALSPSPTASPAATPVALPSATPAARPVATPVATPAATPVATPAATPVALPSATPAARPVATPVATPTATPAATPVATPAPRLADRALPPSQRVEEILPTAAQRAQLAPQDPRYIPAEWLQGPGASLFDNSLCNRIDVSTAQMELTAEQQAALQTASLAPQMPSAHLRDVATLVRQRGLNVNPILLQKNHFVCVVLPIAIRMNAQVYRQRIEVIRLQAASEANQVTAEENAWLASLRQSYGLNASASFTELLARVDVVPVALLLAQAAKETAWGTSRAVEQTNNLFGRRGVQGEACVSVVANGPCLKRYASIVESLADQVYQLNTGDQAYVRRYRDLRARMRREGTALNAVELAETLDGYSQQGRAYVVDLRKIMSEWNQLVKYEFRETATPPARMQPVRREDWSN